MARPTERTVVRVLYDDRYVYVGILAYDSEPQRIATGLVRRDDNPPADLLSVGFDPRHDHLTGYVYITSPKGVQRDFFFFDDTSRDLGYDAVWEVRTRLTDEGWAAEYRIPFAQRGPRPWPLGGGLEPLWLSLRITRVLPERGTPPPAR